MEDKAQSNCVKMEPNPKEMCTAPKEEVALRFRWEQLKDVAEVNKVYTWYTHMQKRAITFGILLMPFHGIVLR